jgi:phytol kinase
VNAVPGILAVLGALGLLIGAVQGARAAGRLQPETSRKLVHLGMGTLCLGFPWIFASAWPVWLLAALASAGLLALRAPGPLRRRLGGALHDVDRLSWGELCFPASVAAVFTLAEGRTVHYVVPVALLTYADAAGALVGRRWGRRRFATLEGTKTAEGSLAVGVTGAACALVPFLLTGHPIGLSLLVAGIVGLFALLLEAIAWRGLDNLFLPLAAYAQVAIYVTLDTPALAQRLGALALFTGAAWIWRRGHLIDDGARLGAALALYFFWAVGGWRWLPPAMALAASYVWLMPAVPGGTPRHNLVAVICISATGLGWAVAEAFAPESLDWRWPFTVSLMTQQAVISLVRRSQTTPARGRLGNGAAALLEAAAVHVLVFWISDTTAAIGPEGLAAGVAAAGAALALFVWIEPNLTLPDDLNARWWRQGAAAAIASAAAALALAILAPVPSLP